MNSYITKDQGLYMIWSNVKQYGELKTIELM